MAGTRWLESGQGSQHFFRNRGARAPQKPCARAKPARDAGPTRRFNAAAFAQAVAAGPSSSNASPAAKPHTHARDAVHRPDRRVEAPAHSAKAGLVPLLFVSDAALRAPAPPSEGCPPGALDAPRHRAAGSARTPGPVRAPVIVAGPPVREEP